MSHSYRDIDDDGREVWHREWIDAIRQHLLLRNPPAMIPSIHVSLDTRPLVSLDYTFEQLAMCKFKVADFHSLIPIINRLNKRWEVDKYVDADWVFMSSTPSYSVKSAETMLPDFVFNGMSFDFCPRWVRGN